MAAAVLGVFAYYRRMARTQFDGLSGDLAGWFLQTAELCGLVHPALRLGLSVLWCRQCLAVKGLKDERTNVYRKLTGSTLEEARKAVSRIVGRDTERLTAEGGHKSLCGDGGGELLRRRGRSFAVYVPGGRAPGPVL